MFGKSNFKSMVEKKVLKENGAKRKEGEEVGGIKKKKKGQR
jgi:hypothetical protein